MANKQHDLTAYIYDKKGRLLSLGKNSYIKTHPLQAKHAALVGEPYKQSLHAEIHAISRCKNLARAHRIVVMRFNKDGSPALAKPCPICLDAISMTPIKIIEHS